MVALVLLLAVQACTTDAPKVARFYAVQVPDEPGRISDTIVINTSRDSVWLDETMMFGYIDGLKIQMPNQWQEGVYGRHPIAERLILNHIRGMLEDLTCQYWIPIPCYQGQRPILA